MQISRRSRISLSQLLGVIDTKYVHVLLDKYGMDSYSASSVVALSEDIQATNIAKLSDLLVEVISTGQTLRNHTSPKYKYDDQFEELRKSLLLDGYLIENTIIKSLDPNYEGKELVEDALLDELKKSGIDNDEAVKMCVLASASDFVKQQPDFNGSLTNIRIALETIVRKIAKLSDFVGSSSGNTWGPSLAHLKKDGFLTDKEEKALASVFTFISNGAHIPIGFSEEEFVRLGRNLCASMCYFVIKKYNA